MMSMVGKMPLGKIIVVLVLLMLLAMPMAVSAQLPEPEIKSILVTLEGAAFPIPDSLEDDVSEYRKVVPEGLPTYVFLLATKEELSLVFTREKVDKGLATVEGEKLLRSLTWEDTELSVIKAESVSIKKEGDPATISAILSNPDEYVLKLVKVDATLRQVSILYDPDDGTGIELPVTVGVVVDSPRAPVDFVDYMPKKVKGLHDNPSRDLTDRLLGDITEPYLHTFHFEEDFWIDSRAVINAIVLYPKGAIADLIRNIGGLESELIHTDEKVLLYIVETRLRSTEVPSVREMTTNPDKYKGNVVTFTAFGKGGTISVQEAIKESEEEYPPADVLLHGLASWNKISVPPEKEDVLLTMGASSHHQDYVLSDVEGEFKYIGKVISSTQINESLPEGLVLITYGREKIGQLDYMKLAESAKETIEGKISNLNAALVGPIPGEIVGIPKEITPPEEIAPASILTPVPTPTPYVYPTPTPTPVPGFEVVFAIIGLLVVAYLIRRRR